MVPNCCKTCAESIRYVFCCKKANQDEKNTNSGDLSSQRNANNQVSSPETLGTHFDTKNKDLDEDSQDYEYDHPKILPTNYRREESYSPVYVHKSRIKADDKFDNPNTNVYCIDNVGFQRTEKIKTTFKGNTQNLQNAITKEDSNTREYMNLSFRGAEGRS